MSTIVPYSNDDPEKLFICPYFKEHVVRACRFNQHLRKCRKIQGGEGFLICPFNRSHHIPKENYNHHLKTCPDMHVIQQDIDEAQGLKKHTLPALDHHPEYAKPESTEDWDAEFEQHQVQKQIEEDLHLEEQQQDELEEDLANMRLLPEHPPNWESMTKAQKTNYKRKYKKQQEKLKENGLTAADFDKSKNPEDWTEEEREAKINMMLSLYPPPKVTGSFKDYKSVLNQYCQKNRINQPKYAEVSSCFSGFACEVIVAGKSYRSHGHLTNKKTAAHSAAKWALMALEIPEAEQSQLGQKLRPARAAADMAMLRAAHEVGLLQQAGHLPPTVKSAPHTNHQVSHSAQEMIYQASRPSQEMSFQVPQPVQENSHSAPRPMNYQTHQPAQQMTYQGAAQRQPPSATQKAAPELLPPSTFVAPAPVPANNDSWQTVGSKRNMKTGRGGRGRGTTLANF